VVVELAVDVVLGLLEFAGLTVKLPGLIELVD
jgi:hypothetical protein